ncbi:MAG: TIGR01777 family oxidoreductase [Terriglobales bacterium]
MDRVLISGASGPIGTALVPSLEKTGAEIARLVRGAARNAGQVSWDPLGDLRPAAVSGFRAVVHLAGESVVGRWTAAKKQAIRESRVRGTRSVASALARAESKPQVLVCASAIGFYGNRADQILTEESASGSGFLAEVSREWEAASKVAAKAGIRTVNLRIGLVLSGQGGALPKMLTPFKMGLGGRLGSGKQWWSWIHVDDIIGAIHHVLETESLSGPVNLVSPGPVRNQEFTNVLARVLARPAFLPVPAFAARLALGEMAEELMLSSQRVEPAKLRTSGYRFQFEDLRAALEDLV